jgi:hypothetical protein
MVPATYPTRLNGTNREMIVGKVASPVAAERWLTWIPIKVNASAGAENTYGIAGNIGGIRIYQETSLTGLIPFKDYVPVSAVVDADTNAWNVSASGFIPVYGTYV